jgi:hypothetical protein
MDMKNKHQSSNLQPLLADLSLKHLKTTIKLKRTINICFHNLFSQTYKHISSFYICRQIFHEYESISIQGKVQNYQHGSMWALTRGGTADPDACTIMIDATCISLCTQRGIGMLEIGMPGGPCRYP